MLPAAHPARPLRRLLPAALLVAAALLSAQFAMTDSSQAALPGATGFGVATGGGIQDEDATTQARDLDLIRDVGAKWIRIDINWAQIQRHGPSSYDWAAIDRVVAGARSRGLNVLGGILYTPDWARPPGTSATYRPDPQQYAAFAKQAAAHYSALGVHAFEIWNEPNAKAFWQPAPNADDYAALLEAAYPAIKAADPAATVLTGGTAPAPTDPADIAPVRFLRGVYAAGAGGSFDAVAHHPYCWPAYPGAAEEWSAWYQMYGTNPSLRSVMTDNGDAGKKIWATEFGAPTNGPSGSHVSESTQARMLTRAFSLWTGYAWSGPLFTYQGRDQGTNKHTREDFFGLVRADWSPKPAFDAYLNAVATATGSPIVTPTKTDVKVKGKGASSPRRSSVLGRVSPRGSTSPWFAGKVRLRVYRRAHGHWRRASPQRFVRVRSGGRFRTRLGRFGHRVLKPGTYRIRARYLGHRTVKPSASRYRKFKVRARRAG
jgi:hypothetical protein